MELKQKLKEEVAAISWNSLAPHDKRGCVLILHEELDLVETAMAVAEDNSSLIAEHLDKNLLSRPTESQKDSWAKVGMTFNFLIVQPFVLIKPLQLKQ